MTKADSTLLLDSGRSSLRLVREKEGEGQGCS